MEQELNFQQIPQTEKPPKINPETGIRSDFLGQISGLVTAYQAGEDMLDELVKDFKKDDPNFVIPEYVDSTVVDEDVKKTIEKINRIVFEMNNILNNTKKIDGKEFYQKYKELNFLIYGNDDVKIDSKYY